MKHILFQFTARGGSWVGQESEIDLWIFEFTFPFRELKLPIAFFPPVAIHRSSYSSYSPLAAFRHYSLHFSGWVQYQGSLRSHLYIIYILHIYIYIDTDRWWLIVGPGYNHTIDDKRKASPGMSGVSDALWRDSPEKISVFLCIYYKYIRYIKLCSTLKVYWMIWYEYTIKRYTLRVALSH